MAEDALKDTRDIANVGLTANFDAAAFVRKALEREDAKVQSGVKRKRSEFAEQRDQAIDFDRDVGTVRYIDLEADDGATKSGYFCEVCQLTFHDSGSYLRHINSARHQARLGKGMAVRASSLADVRKRIRQKIAEKYNRHEKAKEMADYDFSSKVQQLEVLERQREEERKATKKARKEQARIAKEERKHKQPESDLPAEAPDEEMLHLLGISGFGSTSK